MADKNTLRSHDVSSVISMKNTSETEKSQKGQIECSHTASVIICFDDCSFVNVFAFLLFFVKSFALIVKNA